MCEFWQLDNVGGMFSQRGEGKEKDWWSFWAANEAQSLGIRQVHTLGEKIHNRYPSQYEACCEVTKWCNKSVILEAL